MDVSALSTRQSTETSLSISDLISIACNKVVLPAAPSSTSKHTIQIEQVATGSTLVADATELGGDNDAIDQITPRYFSKATAGTRCVAFVSSLDWADENLTEYEFLKFQVSSNGRFLVSGVMSTDAEEGFNPFSSALITGNKACFTGVAGQMFD